jgi:hypothetical protein
VETQSAVAYHPVTELEAMPLAELNAQWEVVPTARQRRYKAMYDKELRNVGVTGTTGADALEKQVVLLLLKQYAELGLVPAGEVWVKTPVAIRERAESGEALAPTISPKPGVKQPPLALIGGIGLLGLVMIFLLIGRGRGPKLVAMSSTGMPTSIPHADPLKSPTPTALALEDQDSAIQAGDTGSKSLAYPVNLRVQMPGDGPPRVFVVQRRQVRTAEWGFDTNPDIASFLTGMSVRPVIGIPWSPENAALFKQMGTGTVFTIQLNTGASLRYDYDTTQTISRSDTSQLRQVGPPGLQLVSIGERDDDGAPTAPRILVTGSYAAEQELSREGMLLPETTEVATVTPTLTPTPAARIDVEVISITSHEPTHSMTVELRVFNDSTALVRLDENSFQIAYGYAPHPTGPTLPAEGLQAVDLLAQQAVDVTVVFPWAGEPYGTLSTNGLGPEGRYEFMWGAENRH